MKRISILSALVAILLFASPADAQGPITVSANNFTADFPRTLVFQLQAQSSAKITGVALVAQIDGVPTSSRQVPDFTPDTQIKARYEWSLTRNYLPPGVSGVYYWTIEDSAGNKLETSKQPFRVDDASHPWQKLSNDKLALNWYAGGAAFGKALFDNGVSAMSFIQQDTNVAVDRQIQIWIYGSRSEFFRALEPGAAEWTGGRAFPEYTIILIDIEPSNLDWGKGATAHEITHQVIHQKIRSPLGDLSMPHWVDEGLAVYYEGTPGQVDPQFSDPLQRAIKSDTLVPVRTLTGSFPADSRAAELAYGQSWSVVDFIFRKYGKDKMAQLLQGFKTGGAFDDIFTKILGVDTDGLENQWRADIGAKPRTVPTRDSRAPTAFPTFGLSTDDNTPAARAAASPTPQSVARNVTTAVPPTSAPSAPSNPISTFCGGGFALLALGIFGAMKLSWDRRAQ